MDNYLLFIIGGLVILIIAIIVAINRKEEEPSCPPCEQVTCDPCPEQVCEPCDPCPEQVCEACPQLECPVTTEDVDAMMMFLKTYVFNNRVTDQSLQYIVPHFKGIFEAVKQQRGTMEELDIIGEMINTNISIIFEDVDPVGYEEFVFKFYECVSDTSANNRECIKSKLDENTRLFLFDMMKQIMSNVENNYEEMIFPDEQSKLEFIESVESMIESGMYQAFQAMRFSEFNEMLNDALSEPPSEEPPSNEYPTQCRTDYDPVCACYDDNECYTYSNDCEANNNDTEHYHYGECVEGPCQRDYQPVCACTRPTDNDGCLEQTTFDNSCLAGNFEIIKREEC